MRLLSAADLRDWLERWKAEGCSFDEAWAMSIGRTAFDSDSDRAVLEGTRSTWQRAYEGLEPLPGEIAAGRLVALFEAMEAGEPLDDRPPRQCGFCGGPMDARSPQARYCCGEHERQAARERQQRKRKAEQFTSAAQRTLTGVCESSQLPMRT